MLNKGNYSLRCPRVCQFFFTRYVPSLSNLLGWRADCQRHHEETITAVRQTANEQVPFNVQGVRVLTSDYLIFVFTSFVTKYLDEFSKALASEVRMLLGEVGKLREERRALQQ